MIYHCHDKTNVMNIYAGPLTIIDRYAFFQLFLIDPRVRKQYSSYHILCHSPTQGLIPSPEEEVELLQLNEPLLDAIPDSADFILNDTNPPFGMF